MSTPRRLAWAAAVGGFLAVVAIAATAAALRPRAPADGPALGRPATRAEISAMDITVDAAGNGLPPGSGSVAQGAATFAEKCEACHGPAGAGGDADSLTGATGERAALRTTRTVASYWPYAPPLFDYIRRAMPLGAPQSLSDDEVYGLAAYILSVDGVVPKDAVLDARSLPKVVMPNRRGFSSLEARGFDGNLERPTAPR
jgi:cytochrome c